MTDIVHIRQTCRLCNSADLVLALPLRPSPIADAYLPPARKAESARAFPLDLHLCRTCGHVQLLTVIDPSVLFGDYVYVTKSSPGLVEHFRRYADAVVERMRLPGDGLVVEIGSNDGTLIGFFQAKGYRAVGIDPARRAVDEATAAGVETICAFFDAALGRCIREERGPAALVAANNVFAHADDLGGVADGVREMLAPDGVFVFEVSYVVDIVDNLLFDTVYHEHLCYHSIAPFVRFFDAHGMELIDVERIASKGGSIRGFAQRKGGPRPVAPIVGELLAMEASRGMATEAPYAALATQLAGVKQELHALLGSARASGRRVVGFGASATVTTLVHHFELGPALEFLVDDNPRKHGTVSPGYHLPVHPSAALVEEHVHDCVVLAWNYAPLIVERQQPFLAAGGRFIVPMPRVESWKGADG